MKRFLTVAVAMLALTGMGQVAMRKLEDLTNTNLVCVTDYGPQVVSLTQRVTGLQSRTSYWDTAYSWGDWSVAVGGNTAAIRILETNTVTRADTNGWETGSHASFLTSAPPQSVVSVNGQTGAVVVTAAQIGALTNELDLAALRAYHYGSPDIVESPAEWFVFDGAGKITAFNWEAGRTNVVIPWAIGGVPVTGIGESAFQMSGIVAVIAPQTVTAIGSIAFNGCYSLASVSSQATSIGDYAFSDCSALTAVHMGRNAPAEATGVFANIIITPPPNVYVTDPQATGWGAVWNGAPVVRPPLYGSNVTAQAFTLGGDTITEWPSGSVTNAPVFLIYSNVVSAVTVTNQAERPARIYGTGTGTGLVSFASLREPLPVFFEMSGFEAAGFPGAYVVGGGTWQTNRVNLFIAFRSGTNDFVTPITTREP